MKVFTARGLTREDAVQFLRVFEQLASEEPELPQRPPMTPDERRAADKKRRKELENKKKQRR
jgi:hypothetical protein